MKRADCHTGIFRLLLLLAGALLLPCVDAGAAPQAQSQTHDQHQHQHQSPPPSAHQHQHDSAADHKAHAAKVEAFRKTVPEDYRIMERTPIFDSQESLLSGRKLYVTHCAVCHGSLGRGDGPGAAGMKTPPADFLDFEHSEEFGPGLKYWLIARGSKTLGMPGHPKVPPKDIWHLVNYILALQSKVKSEGYDKPPHKH